MPNPFVYLVILMRISDTFSDFFIHIKRKQAKCAKNRLSASFVDQKNGFSANKAFDQEDFGSVIHLFPALDILCEVDFQKNMSSNTSFNSLGNICFYKISETMRSKDKYITQKSNALSVSTLPYRYFDYILSIVLEASKL